MLQAYVYKCFIVSDICFSKYFMLQVLHDPQQVGPNVGGPLVRAGSKAGTAAHMHAQGHAYRSSR
jgi:hypothetical protein